MRRGNSNPVFASLPLLTKCVYLIRLAGQALISSPDVAHARDIGGDWRRCCDRLRIVAGWHRSTLE
jgi:hypothetical protein